MDQQDRPSEPATAEKGRGPSGKMTNSLVALSSAAVLTVYTAGYVRTRSAAERFAVEAADLRMAVPDAGVAAPVAAPPEFVEARTPVETTRAVPVAPVPNSVADAPPPEFVSPASTPEAIADPTPAPPAPADEPTAQSSAAPTTNAAAAEVDSPAAEPPAAPAAPREGQYKDGRYLGWGYSRHGDLEAAVVVQDGRIVSADITQCLTRYSCSVIDMLPAQVLARQNPFVDLISGATESANAFSNAIYRALATSKK